mmetsp:Transcript_23913/g.56612  ORF Transcript_23913/g.56612 Transcript_23913/m.56612 type:complete len:116 (+) Transcript_23913:2185-2532(+)
MKQGLLRPCEELGNNTILADDCKITHSYYLTSFTISFTEDKSKDQSHSLWCKIIEESFSFISDIEGSSSLWGVSASATEKWFTSRDDLLRARFGPFESSSDTSIASLLLLPRTRF